MGRKYHETKYTRRLVNQAVAKRLGYLLEFYGRGKPETLANLQELVGPSYALLDPSCQRMTASWPAGGYSSISILKS